MVVGRGRNVLRHCSAITAICTAAAVVLCLAQSPALADAPAADQRQPARQPQSAILFPDEPRPPLQPVPEDLQPTPPPLLAFTLFPGESQPPLQAPPPLRTGAVAIIGKTADALHESLEHGILREAIRFDNFFGAAETRKDAPRAFLIRWRSEALLKERGHFDWGSTLRADFRLPKIGDRLHFAISGADKSATTTPTLPEDPGTPGFDRTVETTQVVNTELRYILLDTRATDLFLGAGVDVVLPPKAFVRARFLHTQKLGEPYQLRVAETVFAKTPYGPGETTEFMIDRTITPKTLLRWANTGTLSREIKALEWGSALALLHQLSNGSAITEVCGIYGNTSVEHWITNYQLLARYRQKFLRDWLFYEVEPQVNWARDANGSFLANLILTLRLEVVFQGKE